MTVKMIVITVAILGVVLVIAAYLQRGEWAIGIEWVLPVIVAAIIPIKEKEE